MYGATVAAYGVGDVRRQRRRARAAPPLRRGPPHRRLVDRPRHRRRLRRARPVETLVFSSRSCSAVPARCPPGLRRPRADRRPDGDPRTRSPASRLGSRWRGSSARSPRPPSASRSRSAWPSSPSVSSRPPCSTCGRCGRPSEPTSATHSIRSSWPVDASSTPSSGTNAARSPRRHRAGGVIDLARAAACRWPPRRSPHRRAAPTACRRGRSTPVTSNGRSLESVSSSTDSSGGRAVSRARAPGRGRRERQLSTDDEVTDPVRRVGGEPEHRLRHSPVGAVDLDLHRPGRRSGASSPTAISTPSSRTGASSSSSSTASSRSSANCTSTSSCSSWRPRPGRRRRSWSPRRHDVDDRQRVGIVGRRRLIRTTSRIVAA